MKTTNNTYFSIILILLFLPSCNHKYDLAIRNVDLFDSEKGEIIKNVTILINKDIITGIIPSDQNFISKTTIEGRGKLVTPSFIDTHIHLTDLYGDYDQAPEFLPLGLLNDYRNKLSTTYLKYGVTTVKVAGQPEKWIKPTLDWQYNPTPNHPDIYITGAALISDEDREPYIGHVEVESPQAVRDKIQAYHDMGIRHLKLYWRLRYPELKAALEKAKELNMNVCGHIDQNVAFIDSTLLLGLNHYEHAQTLAMNVFRFDTHFGDFINGFEEKFEGITNQRFVAIMMEIFRYVHYHPELSNELNHLIGKMARHDASLSTTIHLFAEKGELTYYQTTPKMMNEDSQEFSEEQKLRYRENFRIMMGYLKKAHDAGVKLVLGTDCRDGGKAVLSEMILLSQAGFNPAETLQIATINGAKAINMDHLIGSIKTGKKANLVIFDKSPFTDYQNFLSKKTIIKDGVISSF